MAPGSRCAAPRRGLGWRGGLGSRGLGWRGGWAGAAGWARGGRAGAGWARAAAGARRDRAGRAGPGRGGGWWGRRGPGYRGRLNGIGAHIPAPTSSPTIDGSTARTAAPRQILGGSCPSISQATAHCLGCQHARGELDRTQLQGSGARQALPRHTARPGLPPRPGPYPPAAGNMTRPSAHREPEIGCPKRMIRR